MKHITKIKTTFLYLTLGVCWVGSMFATPVYASSNPATIILATSQSAVTLGTNSARSAIQNRQMEALIVMLLLVGITIALALISRYVKIKVEKRQASVE